MNENSRPRILIVEDEPETATMLAMMLDLSGYDSITVHGTGQAIQAVSRDLPDAVVLDIMMPDVSGLELCRYLRRDPRSETLPIIAVSARARPEDIRQGLEAGVTTYLTKPITREELIRALAGALGR